MPTLTGEGINTQVRSVKLVRVEVRLVRLGWLSFIYRIKFKLPKTKTKCTALVCVFIPSPVRVGTLLSEVPGTPIGASFFELLNYVSHS